ncbi:dihydrodipicolinate synthase family protein [Amycolatopsis thermophila]|uniref:Dihydrodipicolinate synthase/N-acetylneuraminate lyase n=1 Tax=Amycolatopsis thermophila TaxID=206084 RepID=A0ABU0EXG7_9PSEU|nr:dihydrodipicolinate synthase family protein [Amycolatopsis thermophila]MDQ0379477.1 dihydrodipicolinate synthase/N-acetylneuraminate lyase [Amycolatopsis thermophila]
MQPLRADTLTGVWGSVLLPVNDDDSIDFARLGEAVDALLGSGVHGVYTNGTAGEFFTLTDAEYDRLHELVAARASAAGVPFQLGASHPSGQLSRERVRRAAALRPGAIQVVLPDWLPLGPDEAVAALRGLADAADGVPLVLYHPPYAKTQVGPDLLERLAGEVPELIGVKVPGIDVARRVAGRLAVFVAGHTLASARPDGAAGSYSNVACLSPAGAVRWWEQMRTDPSAALDLERRLREFIAGHIVPLGAADPALDKTLAAIGGWAPVGTRVRWPHRSVPAGAIPALRAVAQRLVPELLG